jgi:hypothetical protein
MKGLLRKDKNLSCVDILTVRDPHRICRPPQKTLLNTLSERLRMFRFEALWYFRG